ncbi:MAG TPA: AI-2E family transporter, partial [Desulfobacterales bacterium]|nr:AI-2E family transporter [Desulfobacterales bacterium]
MGDMAMTEDNKKHTESTMFIGKSVEVAVRIGLIGLLVAWSFLIIRAFIDPVLWGVIIAIGFYPLHQKLAAVMGNREKLAALLLTIFALAVLAVPTVLLTDSTISGIEKLKGNIENGTLTIPTPSDKVAGWPVIGKPIDRFWRLASENMDEAIHKLTPFLKEHGKKVLSAIMGLGLTILQFVISIIIAGVLLVNAGAGGKAVQSIFSRVAGEQGETLANLAGATIRSVVQGVLGIAVIQALLAGAGLFFVGVPAAGLWALMVLFLAIVQLPTILVIGPIVVYVFS